ncbi:ectoine hydroxylase [Nitratireductor pacificus]|uniref:Ectoine hydroxylase n=1 Tax=Nitratireductor pacificus pht-3B TaxID=391937 RepID=K2N3I4_9HYPH|nr:ectoine hydroxylase [Nitratireductor pacificus]EKF18823.1 ectoine hydroxylase [Nitratireductor pacificus pht-3B]
MTAMSKERDPKGERAQDPYPSRLPEERFLPRQDKTVWSQWRPDAPLTAQQADQFDRDGFLIVKDVFSAEEIEALMAESAALRGGERELMDGSVITEPGSDEVRTVFKLPEQSPLFNRLARDRRVAGVASFLLGDEVYVHQSRLNYKPGFTGKEFYWHSDFETWHAEDGMPRMRAISASLLLTDNDALNGPLMLMPGSHKEFIACAGETPDDNHKASLKKQEVGVPSHEALTKLASRHGITAATGKAGTLVFFDCNTMHGSNGNITPFSRSNAFFVFNAMSNRLEEPFGAKKARPDFLAERGEVQALEVAAGKLV